MPRAAVNGIEVEYETTGQGEPLLLVMGLGAQLIHWPQGFCQRLVDRGFRVIKFDNRDSGLSTKLDQYKAPRVKPVMAARLLGLPLEPPYTLSDMASDVAGLLDHLGLDSAHVLGVSMGGMIAQTLAIEHPHRVRSLTSIMSTPGGRLYGFSKPRAIRALLGPGPRSVDEAISRALQFSKACGSTKFRIDHDMIRNTAARAYERCFTPRGFMRQTAAIVTSASRVPRLRELSMPSLVVHGTVDPLIPPYCGRGTARAIPRARLRLIEGMGHDLPSGVWRQISDAVGSIANAREPLAPPAAARSAVA